MRCVTVAKPTQEGKKPKPRVWRIVGWAVLGFVALVLVSGGMAAVLIFHSVPPPNVKVDPAALQQLQAEWQSDQAQTPPGAAHKPHVLLVDEGQVNAVIRYNDGTENTGAIPSDMKVKIEGNLLHVYMSSVSNGRTITADLEIKLHVQDGYVQVEPISGRIGSLPIPQRTLEAFYRAMTNSPAGQQMLRLPPYLSDLRVEDSKIVAVFR
jgi:hypothetical protein